MDDPMVEALLAEREGYLRRGQKDRAAAVTAELEKYGHTEKAAPAGNVEEAVNRPVRKAQR